MHDMRKNIDDILEKRNRKKRSRYKRRYRKWKRILFSNRSLCILLLAVVILFMGGLLPRLLFYRMDSRQPDIHDFVLAPAEDGIDLDAEHVMETDEEKEIPEEGPRDYVSDTPRKWESSEIPRQLDKMKEQYPELQPVVEHIHEYPETLLAALCSTPEMIDYALGYLTADSQPQGEVTEEECSDGVPLLLQWDSRWGYAYYGEGRIGLNGCAPTCLSMVLIGLTGDLSMTPDRVADFAAANGHYIEGTGTSWSLMSEGCQRFGLESWEVGLTYSQVVRTLEAGHPIICSMGPGDFTSEGHFIVLTGVENGKIRVHDPNSRSRSGLWDYETLEGQIKNLWAFQQSSEDVNPDSGYRIG
ncbi:MAG: C39 family peptidase [Clostridiales bacterium]|nr:C39 family peptidase [Clostridiales bacterium]